MKYRAYWLNDNGVILPVPKIHIAEVISTPERFGYTLERIRECYEHHHEPIGHEGNARIEIMSDLIKNGWVRVRYTPATDTWTVELHTLTDELRIVLKRFFSDPDVHGNHPYADVRIVELSRSAGLKIVNTTVSMLKAE